MVYGNYFLDNSSRVMLLRLTFFQLRKVVGPVSLNWSEKLDNV